MDKPQRILVVDDQPTNRTILMRYLAQTGYEMLEAGDGFEAVEIAAERQPDLILLDIIMPGRDGFDVCRILKSQEETAAIPVIFLSAKSDSRDVEQAFALGGCDFVTKPFRTGEVKARVAVHLELRKAQQELVSRNQQLESLSRLVAETNIELARQARTDPLTELLNRRAWVEMMKHEHDRWLRHGRDYTVVMIDVDYFKAFNDSLGHQAGDDCIQRIAKCFCSACRNTDVIGRYGGEEFVLLAPETDIQNAMNLAERVRKAVFELNIYHPQSPVLDRVTVSLGVSVSGSNFWEDILKQADDALYTAKRRGRNCICTYSRDVLPREGPAITQEPPSGESARVADTADDGLSILLVDHDFDNRAILIEALAHDGYRIREAADAKQALDEVHREPPHVILMEAELPDVDGLECARRIKAIPETQDIPIILVSARAGATDIRAGMKAGADEVLTRPIRTAELALRVRSMAERQRDRRRLLQSYEQRGEQTRVLSLLLDYCRKLGTIDDLDECLQETIATTAALIGCRRVSIMLPDEARQSLGVAASIGLDEQIAASVRVRTGQPIAGRVFESGRRTVINREREAGPDLDRLDSKFFASTPLLCTALTACEHVVGVLNVTDRIGGRPFESRELDYIDLISGIAGTAVHSILTRRARDEARDSIMVAFARLAEHRDGDARRHVDRVTQFCLVLANELRRSSGSQSPIDDAFLHDLERAVPLHDIGKIAIPDRILLKPGSLTTEEMTIMRTHAEIGAETVRTVRERAPGLTMLAMAQEIASSHHEWYDGSGYPYGLAGEAIPLSARIAALADVYDAVTNKRVYKEALSHEEGMEIILKGSGTQFDPAVVEAFLRRERDFVMLKEELADAPVASVAC